MFILDDDDDIDGCSDDKLGKNGMFNMYTLTYWLHMSRHVAKATYFH